MEINLSPKCEVIADDMQIVTINKMDDCIAIEEHSLLKPLVTNSMEEINGNTNLKQCLASTSDEHENKNQEMLVKEIEEPSRADSHLDIESAYQKENPLSSQFFDSTVDEQWYGLKKEVVERLGLTKLMHSVVVSGLQKDVSEAELRNLFGLAGTVRHVALGDLSVSIPLAVVEFDHPLQAVQAISMFNGKSFHKQALSVKMADTDDRSQPPGLPWVGAGLGAAGGVLRNVRHHIEVTALRKRSSKLEVTVKALRKQVEKLRQQKDEVTGCSDDD